MLSSRERKKEKKARNFYFKKTPCQKKNMTSSILKRMFYYRSLSVPMSTKKSDAIKGFTAYVDDAIIRRGWRLENNCVYKPNEQYHAFQPAQSFDAFIEEFLREFFALHFYEQTVKAAMRSVLVNRCLPSTRQYWVWSFSNGIYDAQQDKFWPYDDPSSPTAAANHRFEYSIRYIDQEFDHKRLMNRSNPQHSIVVDKFQELFDEQELTTDVQEWCWALLGRLLMHACFDNWQHLEFWIKGEDDCGKKIFRDTIYTIYDNHNVHLATTYDPTNKEIDNKLFVIVESINENFSRNTAVTVANPPSRIYLADRLPSKLYQQAQSIACVMFKHRQVHPPKIEQIDAILVRACRAYKQKCQLVGDNQNIWNFLPPEFKLTPLKCSVAEQDRIEQAEKDRLNKKRKHELL